MTPDPSTRAEQASATDTSFADLAVGDTARIVRYENLSSGYRRKLMSLGLTPGTHILVKRAAPLGDPLEIRVRGFSLSLRRAENRGLIVEKLS